VNTYRHPDTRAGKGKAHPAPSPQKGAEPQFLAHVCCGQTAGWIKMPLGMQVGFGPGHIVLDRDQAPSPTPEGHRPPIFGPCLLWPNGRPSQLLLSTCFSSAGGELYSLPCSKSLFSFS